MNHNNIMPIIFSEAAEQLMETSTWIEKLLYNIESIKHSRGTNRNKELEILETKILIKIDTKSHRELIINKINALSVHFNSQLIEAFPVLTKNELMLCCYLKLGLKTKTISILKEIDSNSISMAKYRIKKKMELPDNTSLVQFIQSI